MAKKKIYGPLYSDRNLWFGCSKNVETIYLTNMIPESEIMKNDKVAIIDIFKLWDKSSDEKKNLILDIFGLTLNDIQELKRYQKVVLTQPLDIDYGITEEEKINFYSKYIGGYNVNDIVIKTHPREDTDYSKFFPNAYFFNKKIPLQLLEMCRVEFKEFYTINSSGVFGVRNDIIVHELKYEYKLRDEIKTA